jgi:hypothetical protein
MGDGVLFSQVWSGRDVETTRLHLAPKWRTTGSILSLSLGINDVKRDIDGADENKIILEDVRNGFDMFQIVSPAFFSKYWRKWREMSECLATGPVI